MVIKLMGDKENKKLFANHGYSVKNGKESPPCKHFSIRGYVASMRQKELKMCSLFPVNESDAQPSLPPMVVPMFSSWSCNKCRGETELNVIGITDERELCTGNQETQINGNVPTLEEVNIHNFIDLTGDTDDDDDESNHIPINKALEVACQDKMIDHDPSLENNLSQVSIAQAAKVYPSLIQEKQANQRGFEGNAASNMELDTSNLKTEGKSCSKVSNKRKHIYEGNQSMEELRKSCKLRRKDGIDMVTKNDVLDHQPKKRNHRPSKRHKKMRLLKEIFRKDDEPNLQLIRQEGETNTLGEPRFSSTIAISGNGALIQENDDNDEARSAQNMIQGSIKCDNNVSNEASPVENEVAETLLRMSLVITNVENEIAETQNKQSKERDFDLNIPYFDDTTDQEKLNRYNIDLAVELDSNQRISIDLNSAPLTGANDPILNTILNPGEPSNTNLSIDYSCTNNFSPAESQGPIIFGRKLNVVPLNGTSERLCWMNQNPAEFTTIEAGNLYMMDKQGKAKKRVWKETHGSSSMQRKKSKKH